VFLAVLAVSVSLLTATHRHHDGSAAPASCVICQAAEQASATPAPQSDFTELPPDAVAASAWPTVVVPVLCTETPAEARAPPA
jgi:hypothetical protein